MPGSKVDQIGGDEEWRQPARAALVQRQRPLGDPRKTADAGADHHSGALAVLQLFRPPPGILDRLSRSRERKDDEAVHLALILGRDPVVGVEETERGFAARHLRRDSRRQIGNVERLDRADPGDAREQALPIPFKPDP